MGRPANTRVVLSENAKGKYLSEALAHSHDTHLDLRCGGKGTCKRCTIILESGTFELAGQITHVLSPRSANACQTRLLSDTGIISVPALSLMPKKGQISTGLKKRDGNASGEAVLAIDIGTTTVVASVLRPDGTKTAASYNQQLKYGDNVAARISFASGSATNLATLKNAVINETLNHLLAELGDLQDVVRAVVSGNTVMTLLFFGISPESLGAMPFTPPCRTFPELKAGELGLKLSPELPVLAMPAIAAYVGGDITAGIFETRLGTGKGVELLVDMGTNCEIVLSDGKKIYASAAAAGPAFEGAGLSCGCRATTGAVDHIDSKWNCHVIGDASPKGLCGSAMIDFLAEAHAQTYLNEFGRLNVEKLKREERYQATGTIHAFKLAPEIFLSESDIEQLLKAKAAVYAGIVSLVGYCGQTLKSVKKIYLAGGFAQYIELANAIKIGLLPALQNGEYVIVGNSSLAGAAELALNPELKAKFHALIDIPEEVHLNCIPDFESNYIDALLLPGGQAK